MREYSETELKIRDCVIQQMKTKPFYKIKAKSVADQIGIGRSTFYAYYDSIFDVVQQIEDNLIPNNELDPKRASFDTPYSELSQGVQNFINVFVENAEVISVLSGPNGDARFTSKLTLRVKKLFYEFGKSKGFNDVDSKIFSEFASSGYISSLLAYVREENFKQMPVERFIILQHHLQFKSFQLYKAFLDSTDDGLFK